MLPQVVHIVGFFPYFGSKNKIDASTSCKKKLVKLELIIINSEQWHWWEFHRRNRKTVVSYISERNASMITWKTLLDNDDGNQQYCQFLDILGWICLWRQAIAWTVGNVFQCTDFDGEVKKLE